MVSNMEPGQMKPSVWPSRRARRHAAAAMESESLQVEMNHINERLGAIEAMLHQPPGLNSDCSYKSRKSTTCDPDLHFKVDMILNMLQTSFNRAWSQKANQNDAREKIPTPFLAWCSMDRVFIDGNCFEEEGFKTDGGSTPRQTTNADELQPEMETSPSKELEGTESDPENEHVDQAAVEEELAVLEEAEADLMETAAVLEEAVFVEVEVPEEAKAEVCLEETEAEEVLAKSSKKKKKKKKSKIADATEAPSHPTEADAEMQQEDCKNWDAVAEVVGQAVANIEEGTDESVVHDTVSQALEQCNFQDMLEAKFREACRRRQLG